MATIKSTMLRMRMFAKSLAPYFPLIVRLLLVSTFLEDGLRVLFELTLQVQWMNKVYGVPTFLCYLLILGNLFITLCSVGAILARKKFARGHYECAAAYALIGTIVYQQLMYGHHTPAVLGKFGFLVRNLCLAGAILLVSCQSRVASGRSALPLGILGCTHTGMKYKFNYDYDMKSHAVSYMQLASRFLLVLLALEFIVSFGQWGSMVCLPVVFAVLIGYKLEVSGTMLVVLYLIHNLSNSAFWHRTHTIYMADVLQYEYVHLYLYISLHIYRSYVILSNIFIFPTQILSNHLHHGRPAHVDS